MEIPLDTCVLTNRTRMFNFLVRWSAVPVETLKRMVKLIHAVYRTGQMHCYCLLQNKTYSQQPHVSAANAKQLFRIHFETAVD